MAKIFLFILILLSIVGIYIFIFKNPSGKNPFTNLQAKNMIKITSPAFKHGEMIPKKYSCDGENVNPPLTMANAPAETKSFILIVDDPDAPSGTWTHWLVFNIDPKITAIKENLVPVNAVLGTNSFNRLPYGGPCPPSGSHRYFFKVFALDSMLDLKEWAKRGEVENAMKDHVIDQGELMGKYSR